MNEKLIATQAADAAMSEQRIADHKKRIRKLERQRKKCEEGDILAFYTGQDGGKYTLLKIDRVTPSGRILCGRYTLNPDWTIRGTRYAGEPTQAEAVTEEILECIRKQEE